MTTTARCIFMLLFMVGAVPLAQAQHPEQIEWFQERARQWVGDSIPEFSLEDQDGQLVTEAQLQGQVSVLRFFFVGCPPCRKETEKVNRIADRFRPRGVQFVAFTFDPKERTRTFREWKNFRYRVIPNAKDFIQQQMHVGVYPTHMVVNSRGQVTHVILGTDPLVGMKLRRAIRQALRRERRLPPRPESESEESRIAADAF